MDWKKKLLLYLMLHLIEVNFISTNCLCELKGHIDDCDCSVEIIDSFNNLKINPKIKSILVKDYFRYWKVNLNKGCEFWEDDNRCSIRYCHVEPCLTVPEDIMQSDPKNHEKTKYYTVGEKSSDGECSKEDKLGSLDTSLSDESKADFERWAAHDDLRENSFCYLDDEWSDDSQYVDLLINPERFTGYAGVSSHRVWSAIYEENCFKSPVSSAPYTGFPSQIESCLEKRAFYRAVSGLHSSINIHLCAKYLLSDRDGFLLNNEAVWGPNVEEFRRRFDQIDTNVSLRRLKNLYFLYLLELKALAKGAPYLKKVTFYTGNDLQDQEMKAAVGSLLSTIESFPQHFNEDVMFIDSPESAKLKIEFRDHFRNISKIMDCVGCDKCRLWGKLQVTGLGTALKILFSEKLNSSDNLKSDFFLTRNEIVALFNAFGRLSESISSLEIFKNLMKTL